MWRYNEVTDVTKYSVLLDKHTITFDARLLWEIHSCKTNQQWFIFTGQCNIKHIMMLLIKTMTSVLKVLTRIITSITALLIRSCLECGRLWVRSPVESNPKTTKLVFVASPLSTQHQNQNNVSEWSDMSIRGLLFQWARTIKIQLSVLV